MFGSWYWMRKFLKIYAPCKVVQLFFLDIVMFRWKNISVHFLHKGWPKKSKQKNLWNKWQFIHHSKALVEFRRFLLLLKSFRVFLVEKYSKNSEKTWIFDFFYKIVKKWKNSIFIPKTLMLSSKKKFFYTLDLIRP